MLANLVINLSRLCVCVYICTHVHACGCTTLYVCTCWQRSEDNLSVVSDTLYVLSDTGSLNDLGFHQLDQASWPASDGVASVLFPPCLGFHLDSGDPNLGTHECKASTVLTGHPLS